MTINETLEYIHNIKWQGRKPGLERTRGLLAALDNPERDQKFVHIAGTNGKGSTAACIYAVLRKAGYKTGLYTSPHLASVNERMQADGTQITDEELIQITDEIRPFADAMMDTPTEFELITAIGMRYFQKKRCDIVVLETGMGGRLDSTNVIASPEAAVITAIGYDHVAELGPTLTDIGNEKAGIIKDGCDVVVYGGEPDAGAVFERVSRERGAVLHKTDFHRITEQVNSLDGTMFVFEPYGEIYMPLAGAYQPKNAAVAITTLEVLREKGYKIKDEDIIDGLAAVSWPGRFELLGRDPVFILDGAHNPQGFETTAESLRRLFGERKVIFVVGVMADKDVGAMMGHIAPLAQEFIAVQPDYYRAMDVVMLSETLVKYGKPVTACKTVKDGVAEALTRARAVNNMTQADHGIVCALGSLYFSAEIRAAYNQAFQ